VLLALASLFVSVSVKRFLIVEVPSVVKVRHVICRVEPGAGRKWVGPRLFK
jgi:hypothetical protein